MCYSRCPYESWEGGCRDHSGMKEPNAHCYVPPDEEENDEHTEETDGDCDSPLTDP